jgi:hypothetical protein
MSSLFINHWNLYILCMLVVCPNPYNNWFMLKRLKGLCHEMNMFLMACNYKSEHSVFIAKKIKWQVFTCLLLWKHALTITSLNTRVWRLYSMNKTWSRQNVYVTRVNTASWVSSCSSPNSFSNTFLSVKPRTHQTIGIHCHWSIRPNTPCHWLFFALRNRSYLWTAS